MKCTNCKIEISPEFKYAMAKNECPACGNQLLDESSLAIIEDIKATILSEANIREETAQKLAMSIVSKYSISFNGDYNETDGKIAISKRHNGSQQKVAIYVDPMLKEDISDKERERLFEEALRDRYSEVAIGDGIAMQEDDGLGGPDIDVDASMLSRLSGGAQPVAPVQGGGGLFEDETEVNPYVVAEMQKRQAQKNKAKNAVANGSAAVKRI
jgi:Zn-finger nucleic acid-binding protein